MTSTRKSENDCQCPLQASCRAAISRIPAWRALLCSAQLKLGFNPVLLTASAFRKTVDNSSLSLSISASKTCRSNLLSEAIDLPQRAVLTVTSFSDLLAKGPPDPKGGTELGSAAARLVIMVDDTSVTQSEEVYLAATQINLLVSASSTTLLEPGKHELCRRRSRTKWPSTWKNIANVGSMPDSGRSYAMVIIPSGNW